MDDKEKLPDDKKENKDGKEASKEHYLDRWNNPAKNKMGNDISGDVKVANSNGELEGGQDKRWHMDDDEQE